MFNLKKKILLLYIVTFTYIIQSSDQYRMIIVSPQEKQKFGIAPLHKVNTIEGVNFFLQQKENINPKDFCGRTPADYLAIRAMRSSDTNKREEFINAAMLLIEHGGWTSLKRTTDFLFDQMN